MRLYSVIALSVAALVSLSGCSKRSSNSTTKSATSSHTGLENALQESHRKLVNQDDLDVSLNYSTQSASYQELSKVILGDLAEQIGDAFLDRVELKNFSSEDSLKIISDVTKFIEKGSGSDAMFCQKFKSVPATPADCFAKLSELLSPISQVSNAVVFAALLNSDYYGEATMAHIYVTTRPSDADPKETVILSKYILSILHDI